MNQTELLLLALLVILALPYAIWRIGRTEYFAPLVVVQIITGILLGPGVLGTWQPELYRTLFGPESIAALSAIAMWAVMLFVWIAGIELDLAQAWSRRGETAVTAGLALLLPLALGALAAACLLAWQPGWIGSLGSRWQFVFGIGMACAVTALPILILFMDKLEILRQPLGQRVLRYASLDDLAVWGVLALILLDWQRVSRQFAFLTAFLAMTLAFRALMRRLPESDRWFVGLIWLALCGLAADWAGLHYMVGAFLAGVAIDRAWFNVDRLDLLRHHVLLIVMPVFFLSTGLRTQWSLGGASVFLAAALLLLASVGGKLAGVHLAGRWLGWRKGEASVIGWLLQTKALIMIIFANILLDKQIISSDSFTALLMMAVVSTMLTIPFVTPLLARSGRY